MKRVFFVLTTIAALSACGDKPQTLQTNTHDAPA